MPATIVFIRDSMAASGAMALATRGHSNKPGSAADVCATAPQASTAAAVAPVRNDATMPTELPSCLAVPQHPASELIVDSKQEGTPVRVVFQRSSKRTTRRQGRDLDRPVRRIA